MGKLDLNCPDLEIEDTDKAKKSGTLKAPHNGSLPVPLVPGQGPDLMMSGIGGVSPMDLCLIADRVIHAVAEISKCCSEVAREKQKTKQVQAWSSAQVEIVKAQTKQVRAQQEEQTKRFAIQCEKELEEKRIELKGLREHLKIQDTQDRYSHQLHMSSLDEFDLVIRHLISMAEDMHKQLAAETDPRMRESILKAIEHFEELLTNTAAQIVKLRQG